MTNLNQLNELKKLGITITDTFVYGEEAKLNTFDNDVNRSKMFLDGVTVQYTIELNDKTEFLIAFQNEERPNRIQGYAEVSFTTASKFGYDADESRELVNHLDDEEKSDLIIEILEVMADEEGEIIHSNLKENEEDE